MAYGQIILLQARKHEGLGWTVYDNQFRQQAAAGAGASWTEIDPSLMAATVLGAGGDPSGWVCPRCLVIDHGTRECALASLDANRNPPWTPPPSRQPARGFRPYHLQDDVCCRFNWGTCLAALSRFKHVRSSCHKPGHGSHECHKGGPKATELESAAASKASRP